jgi:hypothetical protein
MESDIATNASNISTNDTDISNLQSDKYDKTGGTISGSVTVTGDLSATNLGGTLSTAAQPNVTSVGTLSSLAVSGNLTVDTNTLFVDAANNRVGVGTSSPTQRFEIEGSDTTVYASSSGSEVLPLGGVNMRLLNTGEGGFASIQFFSLDSSYAMGYLGFTNNTESIGGSFVIGQRSGGGYAEQVRIDASGNVGIGGSAGDGYRLQLQGVTQNATTLGMTYLGVGASAIKVNSSGALEFGLDAANGSTERMRLVSTGLSFPNGNGIDFSASEGGGATSSLLDDYEEGTWTPSQGVGLIVVGTFSSSGRYTKIGRMVYVSGTLSGSTTVSCGAAVAICANLPYTTITNPQQTGTATTVATNEFSVIVPFAVTVFSAGALSASGSIFFNAVYEVA